MFIVFNKQKICSYLIALSTVAVLFSISISMKNDSENIIQTSINVEEDNAQYNLLNNT